MTYIDIFAGCGGLSVGLYNAGFHGLFAIEKNKDAFSTLKYNLIDKKHHFLWPDWLDVKEYDINKILEKNQEQLISLRGQVELVAGGPPCQGFSMAGKRNKDDDRNKLVESYISFIDLVQPEALIFENVHGFTVEFKDHKKYSSFVCERLVSLGYKIAFHVIDVSQYGVPQKRHRFILVAMRNHNPEAVFTCLERNRVDFCHRRGIETTTSIHDAISDLEKYHGTCQSPDTKRFQAGIYGNAESGYQRLMRHDIQNQTGVVDSHRFVNHSEEIVSLHNDLLQNAPKGKRITPKDGIVENLKRRGVTVLDANSQSPTITSIPDELVHYEEPRILTVREHARIQSFPDWFEFKGKYTSGGQRRKMEVPRYTQVGNAVPPLFAEQIGLALMEVLNG
ncbi:MAG: DNA cytosine methyltransferase [Spirochaetales bacterium]|nr:DNA cytosine methyltransferase [Spirochaetales bacterium]